MVERTGDLDIHDVGRGTKMPWEVDGRGWHTRDRVDRKGQPCRWDGEILASTIDRIHELGPFSDTDWNARSVVEVAAERKSDGWFLHAITGETWILKLKFRVPRSTFSAEELDRRLGLKTLNEMPELPVYGNEPRVVCRSAGVRQQEVQINVHSLVEIDTPAYWEFVEQAVAAFRKRESRIASKPDDYLPWKKLGQKWHLMRKGFPLGKRVLWEPPVLEELLALVEAASPGGQFLWNNQQVVHRMVPAQREPWASVYTKRPASVLLRLIGPRGCVALGRVKDLGRDRELEGNVKGHDVLKLKFRTLADLRKGDLAALLAEHLAAIGAAAEQPTR
jgi:excinuclease ABC subunit A